MAEEDPGAFDGLERWAAEARAREAAEARVRERWLRTQAEEDARLAEVLAGLAERGAEVVLTITGGRQVQGRLTALGRDFVAVAGTGRTTLVPLSALAWVRPVPSSDRRKRPPVAVGPDPPFGAELDEVTTEAGGAALVDVLARWSAERPRVALFAGNAALTGELRAVGVDVLVVETEGEPSVLAYVRAHSLSEVSLLASG
ncbi:MAG: hypothetical protein LC733_02475 [Actinobacteria bacterium]|nr:hypothetical protein [Actinomycetota bacterium]